MEPLLIFTGCMATAALGYLAAWLRYSRRLHRIEQTSWAAASKFYTAKSLE